MKNAPIRFAQFIDGDCVNERDGEKIENGIRIPIAVEAAEGCEVVLNGQPMQYSDGLYRAQIDLFGYRNALLAENKTMGESCKITLFYLPRAMKKFRVSSDDNLLFLWDINEHKDTYKSIFENPYLAVYKKAHDLYGAKAHLNLFYEFDEIARSRFSTDRPYFNLSMMTDKFREEFRANADWLKLTFHSQSENPARPYEFATAEKILEDCIRVHREIVRFAGPECISDCTTIHFGEANIPCVRALRSLGYRSLSGYFELHKERPLVSYYAPMELVEHVGERDFWVDTEEDIIFGRIDRVTNIGPLDKIMEDVKDIVAHPHRGGFVSIMIHEQYFYEDYRLHLPDFADRILKPCEYLWKNGYVGAHMTEVIQEPSLNQYHAFH